MRQVYEKLEEDSPYRLFRHFQGELQVKEKLVRDVCKGA